MTEAAILPFEFPKHLQHPYGRTMMSAAYALEYEAKMGRIKPAPALVENLRNAAGEIFRTATPVVASDRPMAFVISRDGRLVTRGHGGTLRGLLEEVERALAKEVPGLTVEFKHWTPR